MQTVTTAIQKIHEVDWCGLSSISDTLIFDIVNGPGLVDAVAEFSDPANTRELRYQDGHTSDITYEGYVKLLAVSAVRGSAIRIQLAKDV